MEKKFRLVPLTDEEIYCSSERLYRIQALKDIYGLRKVEKGELGGFVASEDNLSQEGNCWIYDDAEVYDNARIYDNACVCDCAKVYDDAKVYDNAIVEECAEVYENARITGEAAVGGYTEVHGYARITRRAYISNGNGNVEICGRAVIKDGADGKLIVTSSIFD